MYKSRRKPRAWTRSFRFSISHQKERVPSPLFIARPKQKCRTSTLTTSPGAVARHHLPPRRCAGPCRRLKISSSRSGADSSSRARGRSTPPGAPSICLAHRPVTASSVACRRPLPRSHRSTTWAAWRTRLRSHPSSRCRRVSPPLLRRRQQRRSDPASRRLLCSSTTRRRSGADRVLRRSRNNNNNTTSRRPQAEDLAAAPTHRAVASARSASRQRPGIRSRRAALLQARRRARRRCSRCPVRPPRMRR